MNEQVRTKIREAINPEVPQVSSYELAILGGLQHKPTYQGTVSEATIAKRRRDNRVARRSRRINRRR